MSQALRRLSPCEDERHSSGCETMSPELSRSGASFSVLQGVLPQTMSPGTLYSWAAPLFLPRASEGPHQFGFTLGAAALRACLGTLPLGPACWLLNAHGGA